MLAYRRTRLLADVADPAKRRNFLSRDDFLGAYGPFSLARHDALLSRYCRCLRHTSIAGSCAANRRGKSTQTTTAHRWSLVARAV